MTINPAYTFARYIIQEFDQEKFPETTINIDGQNSFKPELLKIGMLQSGSNGLPALSDLVMARISTFRIKNIQNWVYTTGLLGRQKNQQLNTACINETARVLLSKLDSEEEYHDTPIKHLWNLIFQEVYVNASILKKQQILSLADKVSHKDMKVTTWEIKIYRITKSVGDFFNHFAVKMTLGVGIWLISYHVTKLALITFKVSYIPRCVNHLINITPPFIIKNIGRVIGIIKTIYSYWLGIWIVSIILHHTIGFRSRMVRSVTARINYLIWFSWNIQVGIAAKCGRFFYQTQTRIGHSLSHLSDRALQAKLDLGGKKAHIIWMNLLESAKTEGICQLA